MWTDPRTVPFPFEPLLPLGEFTPFPFEPLPLAEFDPFPFELVALRAFDPFPFELFNPLPLDPFPFELLDSFSFNCDFEPCDPDLLTSFFFCFLEELEPLEPFPLLDLALLPDPFPFELLEPFPFPLLALALLPDPFPFELLEPFPFPFELFEAFELRGAGYDSVAPTELTLS